jgi:hypothetical protein
MKPTDALISKFILVRNSACFGQFLCPPSGIFHCTFGTGICYTVLTRASVQDQDVPSWSSTLAVKYIVLSCSQTRKLLTASTTWCSHCGVAPDWSLMKCDAVSSGEWLHKLRRHYLPSKCAGNHSHNDRAADLRRLQICNSRSKSQGGIMRN